MPNEPTAEQAEVRRRGRQRLVGAIVLAAIAVVFIPMVLDPEPRRDRREPSLAIPAKDAVAPLPAPKPEAPPAEPAQSRTVAATDAPPARVEPPPPESPKTEVKKTEAPKAEPSKADPPKSDVAKSEVAKPPRAPSERKAADEKSPPKLEGFAVQVGAFRDADKLAQARDKLKAARLSHYTERLEASGGPLTRLRAGPYPTREAAEKAVAEMRRAGLAGQVVPLP